MGNILEIRDLWVEYRTIEGPAKALNGINLKINKGEALGLVGETGAGKTTTALSILRLLPRHSGKIQKGSIFFEGKNLLSLPESKMQQVRGNKISMVFQNPLTSLNPVFTIGEQIAVVYMRHERMSYKEALKKATKMLQVVGIPSYRVTDFPHQFSGGMRQRVGIAAALACNPSLLIADEPTTALDVTIQAQVLELMRKLQKEYRTSLLMITHDFGIVAELCQKVSVMYAGTIVEYGTTEQVFKNPLHPYTKGLFGSLPSLEDKKKRLSPIKGAVPDALKLPKGCKFNPRCPQKIENCSKTLPSLIEVEEGHYVSCLRLGQKGGKDIE